MSKVLVIGATGYIGQAVCLSLLRSGNYTVYGLARTEAKAKALEALEIIPVLGSTSETRGFTDLIHKDHIDVVVDASGANQEGVAIVKVLQQAGAERLATAKKHNVQSPKLGFVYISGMWVHGSTLAPVNDLDPVCTPNAIAQPPIAVAWRGELEQQMLTTSDVLNVLIVRPAFVYGGKADIWGMLFGPILGATYGGASVAKVPAEVDSMPGLVHLDDLASGVHAAVDKLPLIVGTGVYPIFDLISSCESMKLIVEAAAKVIGFKGSVEFVGDGGNPFAKAVSTSVNGSSARARTLLGWEPKRVGMVRGIEVYARAWMAHQKA